MSMVLIYYHKIHIVSQRFSCPRWCIEARSSSSHRVSVAGSLLRPRNWAADGAAGELLVGLWIKEEYLLLQHAVVAAERATAFCTR